MGRLRDELSARLLDLGRARLGRGDHANAARVARVLRWLRYTGEHELLGRIALAEGDDARAVEILRDPADRYPGVWLLNSFLGEAFSNQGAYAAARERFERVHEHAGTQGWGLFNLAVVAAREDDHASALDLLDRSEAEGEPVIIEQAVEARGYSLLRTGRLEEAETVLRTIASNKAEALLALTLALAGREAEAWAAVRVSFRSEPGHSAACEATRVLLGGAAAREYRLMLDGLIDPATHPLGRRYGMFATARINADDEAEALAIARRIEPDLLDLRIDESNWQAPGEDARKGYVTRGRGHTLYTDVSSWSVSP